jgi:cytochrome b561
MTETKMRYDPITISLHWATALLVVTLFGLAEFWDFLPRGTPLRHNLQGLHISLGLILTAVVTLRIIWRAGFGRRLPEIVSTLPYWAAKGAHYLLYCLLIGQIALGFLFRWAQGEASPSSACSRFPLHSRPTRFSRGRSARPMTLSAGQSSCWPASTLRQPCFITMRCTTIRSGACCHIEPLAEGRNDARAGQNFGYHFSVGTVLAPAGLCLTCSASISALRICM